MSEAAEIREWARGRGMDVPVKGPLSQDIKRAWAEEQLAADPELEDEQPVVIGAPTLPPPDPEPAPAAAEPVRQRKPERQPQRPPRKSLFQRKRPARQHKRVSIENVVSSFWGLGAMALARSPQSIPMSRILAMQAPVAGLVVEDVAKGTIVDRVLQPLARGGEKAEKTLALVGPPLIVGIISARPETYPVLRGPLKMTMMSWIRVAAPAMEKVQKQEAKWAEEFGDIDLDAMIDALWADLPVPTVESEAEEDAIRRARGE